MNSWKISANSSLVITLSHLSIAALPVWSSAVFHSRLKTNFPLYPIVVPLMHLLVTTIANDFHLGNLMSRQLGLLGFWSVTKSWPNNLALVDLFDATPVNKLLFSLDMVFMWHWDISKTHIYSWLWPDSCTLPVPFRSNTNLLVTVTKYSAIN